MFRALLELLFTILIIIVARAVLTAVVRRFVNASRSGFQNRMRDASNNAQPQSGPAPGGGELHKDPVCGTYVAESTPFRRQISGQTFYYCSDACREKHALVAR